MLRALRQANCKGRGSKNQGRARAAQAEKPVSRGEHPATVPDVPAREDIDDVEVQGRDGVGQAEQHPERDATPAADLSRPADQDC